MASQALATPQARSHRQAFHLDLTGCRPTTGSTGSKRISYWSPSTKRQCSSAASECGATLRPRLSLTPGIRTSADKVHLGLQKRLARPLAPHLLRGMEPARTCAPQFMGAGLEFQIRQLRIVEMKY